MEKRTLKVLEYNKILDIISEYASTQMGKDTINNMEPITEIHQINRFQKETSEAVLMMTKNSKPPISMISGLDQVIKRIEIGAVLSPGELLRIKNLLYISRNLKKYAGNETARYSDGQEIKYPMLDIYFNNIRSIFKLERDIGDSILSEEEIADEASDNLRRIRKSMHSTKNNIRDSLNKLIQSPSYQKYLQEPIITVRGDRHVVPVKAEFKGYIKGIVHDTSSTGSTLFVEPMSVVEGNNKLRQLKSEENVEIEKILEYLSSLVYDELENIKINLENIIVLDVIYAKAIYSLELDCIEPNINNTGYTNIKKGRHPLIDKKEVVPIDIYIGKDFNTLVITGPNTGGKTVTLKTIGLLTLMAQSGMHIPAGYGSEISVFKNVFADIGDEQSIEQSLSTFSSHMKNIVEIIREADEESLVLFDELGAGTDPTEGAALAMSILEYCYQIGAKIVATTHYSELKLYALSTEGVENAACEFNVRTLRPTYKLLIGIPGKSNAFAIAQRLNLDENIINRSKQFLSNENIQFEDLISDLERNRQEASKEKEIAKKYSLEAQNLKNELESARKKINNQKNNMINEARRESRKIIEDAKNEAEEIIKSLRKMQEQNNIDNKLIEESKNKLSKKINNLDNALSQSIKPRERIKKPKNLKLGDTVNILTLNQKGTVQTLPDENEELYVQAGIMKVKVHLSNLSLVEEKDNNFEKSKSSGAGGITKNKASTVSNEIDIRGNPIDDASLLVEKYIDDAVIAKLSKVTIIHGKGTGALRAGIHQLLKTNKHVKKFRLGKFGEGEAGVTVVELK